MIKRRLFDTNVFGTYRKQINEIEKDAGKTVFSLVVFYELTATRITSQKRRNWEKVLQFSFKNDLLASPSVADWLEASGLVWRMQDSIQSNQAVALQNDVLICVSAMEYDRRNPPLIVTDNVKHFQIIADHLNDRRKKNDGNLVIVSPKEYFGE